MKHFLIHKSTLIYAALYHKRKFQPDGPISITKREIDAYIQLVTRKLNEEKNIANAFSYEIVNSGEPEYDLNLADDLTMDLLKKAQYNVDERGTISSNSSKKSLSLKSKFIYPQCLASSLRPTGYQECLNISTQPNKDDEGLSL